MGAEMIVTDMDRAWAEMSVGHELIDDAVVEFTQEFEDWADMMSSNDSPEIYNG